jgi:CubicO group peptidase (beta-lactamase class C family)
VPEGARRNKRRENSLDMGTYVTRRQGFAVISALTTLAVAEPATSRAETADAPAAFGLALKNWATAHKIKRAFIVARRDGRTVYTSALGGAKPDRPVPLASLSKAITGACIATLVRDGKLGFETPVSQALARFIATYGKPRDPRLADVTVAQLLTHRAGFATGDDDDPATGRNLDAYLKRNTSRAPPKPSLVAVTLRATLAHAPATQYGYGNAAYLLLGAIIEEQSRKPYLTYCREAVLAPLGVAGDFAPAWRVSSSMGGWRMRGEDYLAFFDLFAADDTRLGAVAKQWMLDPTDKGVPFDSAAWYGLGTLVRKAERGADVWHWGSWDYTPEPGEKGTARTNFVAHARRFADGTAWFVYAEPRVEEGAPRTALTDALTNAYRPVGKRE